MLDFIKQYGQFTLSSPLKNRLPDFDDEPFLEVAIAGMVKSLVTGNKNIILLQFLRGYIFFLPLNFLNFIENKIKTQNQALNSDG